MMQQQQQQQNEMRQYNMPQPMYPAYQPQSAGLSRKPPGFEFMNPKLQQQQQQPGYNEYDQAYVQPNQFYAKQSASPLIPVNSGYAIFWFINAIKIGITNMKRTILTKMYKSKNSHKVRRCLTLDL